MVTTWNKWYSRPATMVFYRSGSPDNKKRPPRNHGWDWWLIFLTTLIIIMLFWNVLAHARGTTNKTIQRAIWTSQYSQQYLGNDKLWERVLAAIQYTESSGCINKVGEFDPAFGCGGTKVAAVIDASRYWGIPIPNTIDGIVWKLLKDDRFAIQMSAAYLGYLNRMFGDFRLAITAYNIGYGEVENTLRTGKQMPTLYYDKIIKKVFKTSQ